MVEWFIESANWIPSCASWCDCRKCCADSITIGVLNADVACVTSMSRSFVSMTYQVAIIWLERERDAGTEIRCNLQSLYNER